MTQSATTSIYVHFPFCETRCHYCDFYSIADAKTRPDDRPRFESALRKEVEQFAEKNSEKIDTIFLGGGTPSMTSPEAMEYALAPLFPFLSPDTEWTMEANPSSVDPDRLRAYRQLGVNRVSMGVQSLRDDHLQALGRVHSRKSALLALERLFLAGFENVSVDLLCGVPGQTTEDLSEAMKQLTDFPITHLSCYLLTLNPQHRMYGDLPPEDVQLEHLLFIHDQMTNLGFNHYEISNFCRPGAEARHNMHYWKGGAYRGFGPSAHSYDPVRGTRWKNISSLRKYCDHMETHTSPVEWSEELTSDQKVLEKWMLSLRLQTGVPNGWFSTPSLEKKRRDLIERGLMEEHPLHKKTTRLTVKGFALSDQILGELPL